MLIRISIVRKIIISSILVVAMFVITNAADQAALGGTFITGDLCYSWSDARWQKEFNAMEEAGMQYLVIQAVANSYPGKATTTIYPSGISNTEIATGGNGSSYPDVVEACLRNAEESGIKVFIGIDMSSYWWNSYANDSTWLYDQMELDNEICKELWENYKEEYPSAFYGWYWSYEIDNVNFTTAAQQKVLIKAMNMQLDYLASENMKLPFMWCPFMNSNLGTPTGYKEVWENIFAGLNTTEGDIFCPQDCVGAGGLDIDEVASWFSALREAVDTKPGLEMWSDVEMFSVYNSKYISATMDRVVSQMEIEQTYVENYVSWEYSYYDSPYNTNTGFHETYLDYLNEGVLETTVPTMPDSFSVKVQAGGDVELAWNASTDNIGICGYYIYRDDKVIDKCQVPIINNDTTIAVNASTSYIDNDIEPGTGYTYRIEAYDFAGNVSGQTSSVTVTTGDYSVISTGCKYTVSENPSGSYPDASLTKLTNGKYASSASYADAAWVGFNNPGTLVVTIDLGETMYVQQFIGEYLLDPQPAVYLPEEVSVSISIDNINFISLGSLSDNASGDSLSSIHKYSYTLSDPGEARYVKFTTVPGSAWLFIDEFEVRNYNITGIQDAEQTVTQKFDLSNNYPNPFNPSTTIKVSLKQPGEVNLLVYNGLGELVKVIFRGYKTAGVYAYNIDMHGYSSGVYFCTLNMGKDSTTGKMLLMK